MKKVYQAAGGDGAGAGGEGGDDEEFGHDDL